jgi:hypothetical protein
LNLGLGLRLDPGEDNAEDDQQRHMKAFMKAFHAALPGKWSCQDTANPECQQGARQHTQ